MSPSIYDRIAAALAVLGRQQRAILDVKEAAVDQLAAAQQTFDRASRHVDEVSAAVERDAAAIKRRRTNIAMLLTASDLDEIEEDDLEGTLAPFEPETTARVPGPGAVAAAPVAPAGTVAGRKRSRASVSHQVREEDEDGDYDDTISVAGATPKIQQRRKDTTNMSDEEIDSDLASMPKHSQLPNCTVITKSTEGNWIELQCPVCHANFSSRTNCLLKGVGAFATHLVKIHKYDKMDYDQCIAHCTRRIVPTSELRDIYRHGYERYIKIAEMETTAPTSRRSVKTKENNYTEEWKFVRSSKNYIPHCSCILKHPDGHWVEVHCPVCEGNWSSKSNGYLKDGLKGFWDHIHHAHGEPRMGGGPRAIIERCKVREVSDEEAESLRKKDGNMKLPHPKVIFSTKKKESREKEQEGGGTGDAEQTSDIIDLTESPDHRPTKIRRTGGSIDGPAERSSSKDLVSLQPCKNAIEDDDDEEEEVKPAEKQDELEDGAQGTTWSFAGI